MTELKMLETLRQHRPLLLACEAIGWLHMAGKAKADFLRKHGGQENDYKYEAWYEKESPPFPWDDLLKWVKDKFPLSNENACWPATLTKFISEHKKQDKGMLGLLQAAHAMASSIEKNIPDKTSKYLGQDITHMWLSSAFGHPTRNLLEAKPEILTDEGWKNLLEQIKKLLGDLKQLGDPSYPHSVDDITGWWNWREGAIGLNGWLRKAFSSTLAETRLPNNDVTLWDQSYVAAALFKSAVAGAILDKENWKGNLKQDTKWRLLTVGMAADHYESRSVKIGDWIGARKALDGFFEKVRKLVEIDLAIGSLLYADSEVMVFTFPGERQNHQGGDLKIAEWEKWLTEQLTEQIDEYARQFEFETPPYCSISESSRSLINMTDEIKKAHETIAVPLHRTWDIQEDEKVKGHICPVCLMRRNDDKNNKQKPCGVCEERRKHRLDDWYTGQNESDTIWITEVADNNDRLALITMSLDIEPWLSGERLDALRAQAISEWSNNSKLEQNPIKSDEAYKHFVEYSRKKLEQEEIPKKDNVFNKINSRFKKFCKWKHFFKAIVEDRANAPNWNDEGMDNDKRARWLTHQLFRKLASPGRIYRFQRQAEEFFNELLVTFREQASAEENRWRTRRLIIKLANNSSEKWKDKDKQVYNGRLGDAPVSLLYRKDSNDFITICNLKRIFKHGENLDKFEGKTLLLTEEDKEGGRQKEEILVASVEEAKNHLGCYHPVIPLEVSPVRFRVIVPLEAASDCIDKAVEKWNQEFDRVWDRLPLRVGMVAFKRMMPFQAVIEAARNIEHRFNDRKKETWRVDTKEEKDGVVVINFVSSGSSQTVLRTIPITLRDGREDVFYPYVNVEDQEVRYPLDFQHPDGQTYRHVKDLKKGDGVVVYPALISTLFMEHTAVRFDSIKEYGLSDWTNIRGIWNLIDRVVPSQTALRGVWSELLQKRESWQDASGEWLEGGERAWLDLVRVMFYRNLGARGAVLETLVQAAESGNLEWCLEWHLHVLKKQVSGGKNDNNSN